MTRPIDETWRVYNGTAGRDDVALEGTRDVILESVGACQGFSEQAEARVRLAATAPTMARLLLSAYPNDSQCFACHHTDSDRPNHAADCALVAVLRAAGAIPDEPA